MAGHKDRTRAFRRTFASKPDGTRASPEHGYDNQSFQDTEENVTRIANVTVESDVCAEMGRTYDVLPECLCKFQLKAPDFSSKTPFFLETSRK